MKEVNKIFKILLICLALGISSRSMAQSCYATGPSMSFSGSGGTKYSTLQGGCSDGSSLQIQVGSKPSWISANPTGNYSIAATASANTTGSSRSGSITILQFGTPIGVVSVSQQAGPPATPPTPSVAKYCGYTRLTRANPPSGVTYYWQSSSSGTSTSNSSGYIDMLNGSTYYLRARDNSSNLWSSARTVSYSIDYLPATPITPTVDSEGCGSVTLKRSLYDQHSGNGNVWYWQSSPSGTSTSNTSETITLTSGSVYYLRSRNTSSGCWSDQSASVSYTIPVVPIPPLSAVDNNCGNTVLTRANPPSGTTYYWQSSSSGTSTSNSSQTVTRTSGSTYYLRARTSQGCWSVARTISYSITSPPSEPPVPTTSNSCGSTVLTRANPPSGVTYYWQSSSSGTSTSNSSQTITRTVVGGTYYIRAYRSSTNCWSTATAVTYTVDYQPGVPITPTVDSEGCGSVTLKRNLYDQHSGNGNVWYWQSSPSGTSTSNTSETITLTSGSIYYLRSQNTASGCWSDQSASVSYTIPVVPIPPLPAVDNNCGNTVLTRANPPSGTTYYWQSSSSGTSTSNSSQTVTRTSGSTYYLRARTSQGCWSAARTISYSITSPPSEPPVPTTSNSCGSTVLTRANPPSGVTYYWQSSSSGTSTSNSSQTITRTVVGGTYYIRAYRSSTDCWSPATAVTYTVDYLPPKPLAPTIVDDTTCGEVTLSHSGQDQGTTEYDYYWQSEEDSEVTFFGNQTITLTEGSIYYLRAYSSASGCWSEAVSKTYTIPTTDWYLDYDNDGYADTIVSQCDSPGQGYTTTVLPLGDCNDSDGTINPETTWYADTDGDGFGDIDTVQQSCLKPSGYVSDNSDCDDDEYSPINECLGDPQNQNYIYTRNYQQESASPIDSQRFTQNDSLVQEITFFDGLGRPYQHVGISQTPKNGSGQTFDVVTHIGYDAYGRQKKEWLPYVDTEDDLGSFRTEAQTDVDTYYQQNYGDDFQLSSPNPFSEKDFESSPLNRVLKNAAPGSDWALGQGHEIGFDYGSNTSADEVRQFDVGLTETTTNGVVTYNIALIEESTSITYANGELYKIITSNENHDGTSTKLHTVEEFTDKQGRVVLKRTYALVNNSETPHDTYYVYDDYGNLTYVLPPKMDATSATLMTLEGQLDELGYQYVYDHRNRLVEKKIPGKGREHIVYNKLDQPIMTRDALLEGQGKWLFTRYDAHGRVAFTGMVTGGNRQAEQTAANNASVLWADQSGTGTTVDGIPLYYGTGGYPALGSVTELHTVNYYDGYNATRDGLARPVGQVLGQDQATDVTGLPTVAKVRVLGQPQWITTLMVYDPKGRAIYTTTQNGYLNTTDIVETELDFTGRAKQTKATHQRTGYADIVTVDTYGYDHVGRLVQQEQTLGGHTELLVHNQYDALGQLEAKQVGNTMGSPLQTVDYTYNVRGWLKAINDPANLGADLFAFGINYNTVSHGGTALYDGNISETEWRTAHTDNSLKWYRYGYDALNRIVNATDNTGKYNVSGITYDRNGNIQKLKREGWTVASPLLATNTGFGTMDDLTYSYAPNTNKLMKVADAAAIDQFGFKDDAVNTASDNDDDYLYDQNGNMTSDANKGITSIAYNHLNLPTNIATGSGSISYVYDAAGTKLQKTVSEGGSVTVYAGNYVYQGGTLQFFSTPEGYVTPDGMSGYDYVYQYKDHLGNVRLSYSDGNGDGDIDVTSNPMTTEIVEESNYYPFGLKHKGYNDNGMSPLGNDVAQKWKYNGVELDETTGLYEMGARMMDPAIGRFISIDPMADFVNHQSPYAMANNNPVANVDEYGLGIFNVIGNLWKRLKAGVYNLTHCNSCHKEIVQESVRQAWIREDFPKRKKSRSNRGSNSKNTPDPTPPQRRARTGNTSGIANVGGPNDFSTADFGNINSSSARLQIPIIEIGPKPIPILGGNPVIVPTRINFSGNDGTVLDVNDNINNRTLNAIVKTLQDYPQIKMHIYVNLLQRGSGTNKEAEEERYRKAVGRRAAAIIKFFENQGIDINRIDWSIDSMRQINNPNSIDVRRRVNNQRFMLINKNED